MFNTLHPNIIYAISGIFIILIVSSLVLFVLQRNHPQQNYSELRSRIHSWWIMAGIFSAAMIINRTISIVFFAIISFLALKEYLSIIPTRRADRRVLFWVYLAIPVQYYWVAIEWYGLFIIFIPVYLFLLLPLRMILIGETKDFLRAVGTLHWGAMTMVFSISHLAYLLVLPASELNSTGGVGLVLYLVCLTQLNDVAQYISGKLFGKHKIIPEVSPNKTWQGFIGGVLVTVLLAAALAQLLTPMQWTMGLVAGLLISVMGFIGDVTISALKRDIGIKDSGQLLPGHGGILDRIDSLTYTAPLFFHFIYYLYY